MKTKIITTIGFLAAYQLQAEPVKDAPKVDPAPPQNKVQIALLLDTSNSMDGLIDQARTQLWKVVNTFVDAKRDGSAPFVEVALYEYGNNGLHVGNSYIRQIEPLSRDLDEISRELFDAKNQWRRRILRSCDPARLSRLIMGSFGENLQSHFHRR
ncbi:MAG: hypothetical protein HC845_12285 [Akkermansiaceae bacterium]|nr:hypothetical protein [Akkermansiaceae bacterium]